MLKVFLVGMNAKFIHSSLALYTLAASCREAGHEVEVAEYTINQEFLYVLGEIYAHKPSIVGFSCYIWNRDVILKLTAALKKVLPKVRVILGGPEASGDATAILLHNPSVDFVIQGEGEESLPDLLTKLSQGSGSMTVSGVAERWNGRVESNGGVRLVENLDRLPFPYQADAMEGLKNRILYYEGSRGCPYSCSYCVSSTTSGVRYRSVEKVKEELRFFLQNGAKQVKFVDRTFNVHPGYYREIWRFLSEEPGPTSFHFEIVADRLSEADIAWLAQVAPGRFQFEVGVQSTSEETLKAIGRHNDWAKLRNNVHDLLNVGNIHLHLDLIIGLPYESWQHFRQSFNDVYGLKPDMLQIGFLKLLPGTQIRQEAEEHGYIWLDQPPYEILSNNVMSYSEIRQLKLIEEVFNQTYNNGRFPNTLDYFVSIFEGDAFRFYHELALWWENTGLSGKPQSPEGVLSRLLLFAGRFSAEQLLRVVELLKFDVLLDDSGAMKGGGLDWNCECWAREKAVCWRSGKLLDRYIPEYCFTNWREVKRKYPIEVFSFDIPHWIMTGEWIQPGLTPVLFDTTLGRPIGYVLPRGDFFSEGEA